MFADHRDDSALSTPNDNFVDSPFGPSTLDSETDNPLESSELPDPTDLPRLTSALRTVSDPVPLPSLAPAYSIHDHNAAARIPRPRPAASTLIMSAASDNNVLARVRDFHQRRMQKSPASSPPSASDTPSPSTTRAVPFGSPPSISAAAAAAAAAAAGGSLAANLRIPAGLRPGPHGLPKSAPVVPGLRPKLSLSERRMGGQSALAATPRLSVMDSTGAPAPIGSKLDDFKKYIDVDKGSITFDGAATITNKGVNFVNGQSFSLSLDEIQVQEELGKGNYGTVYKVRHTRPTIPRLGSGLSGIGARPVVAPAAPTSATAVDGDSAGAEPTTGTGMVMAMKEIRLELDDATFTTILQELLILHKCRSRHIIEFYGAFFQEGAVYMCIEYMDGGSLDKLYSHRIPEPVLCSITHSTVLGLRALKDDHNIIHRDVKPTNILANTRGQVKICDFGVSGNLVASIAKTNIGCQNYMAPERISHGGGPAGTYSVQSDIWSLGLTIIECAVGHYPYPSEVSSTIFSQLSAIVEGEPPDLPAENFTSTARDFVRGCLNKSPKARPTYAMLLKHAWLTPLSKPDKIDEEAEMMADAVERLHLPTDTHTGSVAGDPVVAAWVRDALATREGAKGTAPRPALHTAPLDSAAPASLAMT